MLYTVETLGNMQKTSPLYEEIYRFLLRAADRGFNEHFHWARFEAMVHSEFLSLEYLEKMALFREENGSIAGMCAYDAMLGSGAYLIHLTDDKALLVQMLTFAQQHYPDFCLNMEDVALKRLLEEKNWRTGWGGGSMMSAELEKIVPSPVPEGYVITPPDFEMDIIKYQILLHEGFECRGVFKLWPDDVMNPMPPHWNKALKVFALQGQEYCAHAGVWYAGGDTAYVEPVVALPEHRRKGLAGACLRTALLRARELGAKRAVVMAEDAFYSAVGFENSTLCLYWEPKED